ncbi:MAG: hypothetical protein ACTHJ0_11000 [Flavipsychrobacter sp.]
MRTFGIILVVVGILMAVITGFNFKTEKKVVDLGPLQVNKEENHHVGWPTYTGGIIAVIGIGLIIAGKKKD